MIGSTRSVRVFAYTLPTDMRKGFDGLYGMVSTPLWATIGVLPGLSSSGAGRGDERGPGRCW